MKTIPLDELLKQITQLPYRYDPEGNLAENLPQILAETFGGDTAPIAEILPGNCHANSTGPYLTHAANVLPGLVEALGRAADIARGDLLDGLHGESVSKDDFDAQLRNVRGVAMSLEAILSKALSLATNVPVNS